jgi:hypothetical protein
MWTLKHALHIQIPVMGNWEVPSNINVFRLLTAHQSLQFSGDTTIDTTVKAETEACCVVM